MTVPVREQLGAAVLITGGAGFVGTNLADRLISLGRRVRIYDSLARPGTERNLRWLHDRHGASVEVVRADLRDVEPLRRAVAERQPSFILRRKSRSPPASTPGRGFFRSMPAAP